MIAQNTQNKPETVQYSGKEPLRGKRELFAQNVSAGDKNNTESARLAGYKDHKGLKKYAYLMLTLPAIKARIAFLRAKAAEKLDITREKQVKRYEEVIDQCNTDNDSSNKIKALNSIDKLFGLSIDKQQTELTEAQERRSKAEKRLDAEWAEFLLDRDAKQRKQALEVINEVVLDDV